MSDPTKRPSPLSEDPNKTKETMNESNSCLKHTAPPFEFKSLDVAKHNAAHLLVSQQNLTMKESPLAKEDNRSKEDLPIMASVSDLDPSLIRWMNILRMGAVCLILIYNALLIRSTPRDSILSALFFPTLFSIVCAAFYGFTSFHQHKFYSVRSMQFIQLTRTIKTSVLIKTTCWFSLLSLVYYLLLQTTGNYQDQTVFLLLILLFLLAISANTISWIFYQSVISIPIDLETFTKRHDSTNVYKVLATMETGEVYHLSIDQITPHAIRLLVNGEETMPTGKGLFRCYPNNAMEVVNHSTFLVGRMRFPLEIKGTWFGRPHVRFNHATHLQSIRVTQSPNTQTVLKGLYWICLFFSFLLILL